MFRHLLTCIVAEKTEKWCHVGMDSLYRCAESKRSPERPLWLDDTVRGKVASVLRLFISHYGRLFCHQCCSSLNRSTSS